MKPAAIPLSIVLVLLWAIWAAPGLASCIRVERHRVATVVVESCLDLPTFAAERIARAELPWMADYVAGILEREKGVVVKGTITNKLYVEQLSRSVFKLEESVLADEPGEWFVEVETRPSCEPYPAGQEVQLYITDRCCDMTPPYDVPCALDTGQARPVPPGLKKLL